MCRKNYLVKILLSLFLLTGLPLFIQAADKANLKVLYTGNPGSDRMLDFKQFLTEHFVKVGTISLIDFKPSDADGYDVVLFDWDYQGKMRPGFGIEKILPKSYSRASVGIGGVSANIGMPLNLKIDWLCLCMDHSAHDMVKDHPVFQTPHKIDFKLEEYPTPMQYGDHLLGRDLAKSIPVWRVQTTGMGVLPGLVATGHGFGDSPDAEVISNGLCMKGPESVAIGRHGNFFHWGFSAKPSNMTEQGKLAFINSIHYIKNFDGQIPIVRKKALSREYALERCYALRSLPEEHARQTQERNELVAKQAKGEKLSQEEEENLFFLNSDYVEQGSIETVLKKRLTYSFPESLIKRLGSKPADIDKYLDYHQDNLEYIYLDMHGQFGVDEDAKSLGISNRDPKLLDKSISLLENNQQTDLAKRLLARYTNKTFTTAKQWRDWFTENHDRLFFTDVGGYKFMVNTLKNST